MKHTARFALALTALAVGSVGAAAAAQGSHQDKVWLCHGAASERNPYVLIHVSENALAGHFDGTAPGHGKNNNPDFVLPDGATDCGDNGGEGGGGGGGE